VQELGGSIARQIAKPANGKIHTMDIMPSLRMEVGRRARIFFSHFHGFECSLPSEFELFWEFGLFWEFCALCRLHEFQVP